VRRRGGTAVVTSRIGHGTEVHLTMPFAPAPVADEQPEREERGT
jgi:signal transduction histidine kinase